MRQRVRADDLYAIKLINSCNISPDGENVIFTINEVNKKNEKKYSNLFMKSLKGGKIKQLTFGKKNNANAKYSPDGKKIAFISNRENEKLAQIYILPTNGGEAEKISDVKGIIHDFIWSPDSKKLLLNFQKFDKEIIEMFNDKKKKELGIKVRHFNRVFYKLDGFGYRLKDRVHLYLLDIKKKKLEQLTKSDIYDEYSMSFSPDGKKIIYISNISKDPDLDPMNDDLFIMNLKNKKVKKLKLPEGPKGSHIFSPDGKWVIYLGVKGKKDSWRNTSLWLADLKNEKPPKNLTKKFDIDISGWTIGDLGGTANDNSPKWANNSKEVYFTVGEKGSTSLYKIDIFKPDKIQKIIDRPGVVGSFYLDNENKNLLYYYGNFNSPGDLYNLNLKTGKDKQLTSVNKKLLSKKDLGTIEEVWFKGSDNNDLQGWILKPPNFNPKKKYPSVLEIHGGPQVQYGNVFMHEFYFLAANDYVVYFCNPRGGKGYGEKHTKAIDNAWGTKDYEDIMKWNDLIKKKSYIDNKKMFVTGGSYGGYMTNWIIGHTNRFKGAVTQRSVSNLISMYGSSDFNWGFELQFGHKPPWESFNSYWKQSPIKYIGNAKTPTLVIHSENDNRCPQEQGEQIYVSLKRLGVDTELVLFPGEPHGLSRGGRTDRRIERLNHILRWFNRYK